MKILFAASECVPFIKTGGLADVVGALAPVLAREGHDVRVMLPLYGQIPAKYTEKLEHVTDFEITLGWRRQYCGIEKLVQDGVIFYFVDNKFYFDRSYIYGMGGDEYERYGFFCRAILNSLPELDFQPDVIHCNDWQTGMVPALLKIQYAHLPFYASIKTIFTIHNLQYQGIFGIREVQDVLGLGDSLWTNDKLECFGCANYMKAGLVYTDLINTVSPSYAEEIQTAYYGERLDGLLRARQHELYGVLNGLDVVDYDPEHDPHIAANFTADNLEGKAVCKRALQEELELEVNPDVPIIGMIGRLTNQKGLDLVDCVIGDIMNENVQLVVLGMGDNRYVNLFLWAEGEYKGRVATRFTMDSALAHRIYAGCDMLLMPSQFEPCGLSQMMAMRYGTLPIVRETGGLRDTVLSYNEETGDGNGFTFFNYNAHDMLHVIQRALDYYQNHKDIWKTLQHRGMTTDFSWTRSANKYLELYRGVVGEAPLRDPHEPEDVAEAEPKPVKKPAAKRTTKKAEGAAEPKKPARSRAKKADAEAAEGENAPKKTTRKKAEPAVEGEVKKPARKKKAEPAAEGETPVKKPRTTRKKAAETEPAATPEA